MKTIKVKETDGFKIVVGVGTLSIDPKATQMASKKEIFELPEAVEMSTKAKKKYGHHQAAAKAKTIGKNLTEIKKTEEANKKAAEVADNKDAANACFNKISECTADINKHEKKYKSELGAAEVVNEELKAMLPEFDKKQKDVKRDNPVFCIPGAGVLVDRGLKFAAHDEAELETIEFIPDGATVDGFVSLFHGKDKNQQLLETGEYIEDFRGCQYFYCGNSGWISGSVVLKLGELSAENGYDNLMLFPENDIIEKSDLKPEQSEEIRFQGLTADELFDEFIIKKDALLSQSVNMKNELEIQNAPEPLKTSQEFYNTELEKLRTKYNQ